MAFSDTTRKSQAMAVSHPPPKANPLTAAITGLPHCSILLRAFWAAPLRQSVDFLAARLLRSAPAMKALSPAPVRMTAFTSPAVLAQVKNWSISRQDRSFMALSFSGRLAVRTATPFSSISSR